MDTCFTNGAESRILNFIYMPLYICLIYALYKRAYDDACLLGLRVTRNGPFLSKSRCIIISKKRYIYNCLKFKKWYGECHTCHTASAILAIALSSIANSTFFVQSCTSLSLTPHYFLALLLPKTSTSLITSSLNPAE